MQYSKAAMKKISNYRKQLPRNYATEISANLEGISPRQVICVFNGEITNVKIVDTVMSEAKKLRRKFLAINKKYIGVTTRKPLLKVN